MRRCVVGNCPETMDSMKLCDALVLGKPGQTCDAAVCVDHALHREPDTEYCPQQATLVQEKR